MKKLFLSLFVLAAFTFTSCKEEVKETAEPIDAAVASETSNSFKVDTAKSVVEWVGSKPTGKHNGTIALSSGEIFLNNGKVESGNFIFDMASIQVLDLKPGDGKEDLEAHLKGLEKEEDADHFFNIKKFPEAKFELTSVETVEGKTTMTGNLTIKEITKSVSFPALLTVDGNTLNISSEPFMINRTNWGVNYASKSVFDNLKDKFVNDDIELKVNLTATK
ncbi:YceI family protein [Flavobacterium sp.]|uniref:YceI family protein n=1 Tax=Flavobacterium sp. TaxID=239 RepID=UPI0026339887|nr:YceI family protein [Flavobacterium sp.]MDD2985889.1 YceI family protein [Flavobacterium sp.]